MCNRYTLRQIDLIRAALGLGSLPPSPFEEFSELKLVPQFNISPSQGVPIVRPNRKGERSIGLAKWGLIPHWAKLPPVKKPTLARAETVATNGLFRQAFERRRCLVPADGFYEWQGTKPPRQPFFIRLDDNSIFALAGIWERWAPSPDAGAIDTFALITTEPNDTMRPIHDRMPVILSPCDYDRWLDRGVAGKDVQDLLKPFDGPMHAVPVSHITDHDGPHLKIDE